MNGALIWLPEPLIPAEYPKTGSDLFELIRRRAPESMPLLEELAASWPHQITLVLGFASG